MSMTEIVRSAVLGSLGPAPDPLLHYPRVSLQSVSARRKNSTSTPATTKTAVAERMMKMTKTMKAEFFPSAPYHSLTAARSPSRASTQRSRGDCAATTTMMAAMTRHLSTSHPAPELTFAFPFGISNAEKLTCGGLAVCMLAVPTLAVAQNVVSDTIIHTAAGDIHYRRSGSPRALGSGRRWASVLDFSV